MAVGTNLVEESVPSDSRELCHSTHCLKRGSEPKGAAPASLMGSLPTGLRRMPLIEGIGTKIKSAPEDNTHEMMSCSSCVPSVDSIAKHPSYASLQRIPTGILLQNAVVGFMQTVDPFALLIS